MFCFFLENLEEWSWPTQSIQKLPLFDSTGKEVQMGSLVPAIHSRPSVISWEIGHTQEDTLNGWGGVWEKFPLSESRSEPPVLTL